MTDALAGSGGSLEGFVQGSLSEAWEAFKGDGVLYLVSYLVVLLGSALSLGILMGPLHVGFIDIVRKRRRGEAAAIGDVFGGLSRFGASFVAMLLIGIGAVIGLVLLVIPGLIWMFMCGFVLQTIAYKGLGAVDAIKASIALVKGAIAPVATLMVVAIVISAIGGMVPFGGLLTGPFTMLLMTVGYEKLTASA